MDKTIKVWDPVARPYPLSNSQKFAFIRIKPGYYKVPGDEGTVSNSPFVEVKRIYTGDMYCCKLDCFASRVPIHNIIPEKNHSTKVNEAFQ